MKRFAGRHEGSRFILVTFLVSALLVLGLLAPVAVGATVTLTQEETRMLQLVNDARRQAGLPPLYPEQRLTDMARDYCREMIQYGFFGHNSPVSGGLQQRIAARGITGWLLAGENLAKAPTVDVAFKALMNSASHRENILRPQFNCVGIGVVRGPDGLYVTQEFMQFAKIPSTADTSAVDGSPSGATGASRTTPQPATQPARAPVPGGDRSDTYILVVNPGSGDASVTLVLRGEDGREVRLELKIKANSRCTVNARQVFGQGPFACEVRSDAPVLAERAMYFSLGNRKGGHDSIGCAAPSKNWYFAEGYTGGSFDTWILLQNPNDSPAAVTLRFMRADGRVIEKKVTVQARRRHTVHVDEIPGLEDAEVSTSVLSDLPVVAERAMYFVYGNGLDGGHETVGVTTPSKNWYFAEGYTGGSFDTWILLQNPNDSPAAVTLRFMRADGRVIEKKVTVQARRRHTVHVDEIPGLEDAEVSTSVLSDLPVVAERAMYFVYNGKKGGHCSVGARSPSNRWYLAEGYTGGNFHMYVLLQNPNGSGAVARVRFMKGNGECREIPVELPPHSRRTVFVNSLPGLSGCEVGVQVQSDLPVIVERSQYFDYGGLDDGTNSIGAINASRSWYFAEGFCW